MTVTNTSVCAVQRIKKKGKHTPSKTHQTTPSADPSAEPSVEPSAEPSTEPSAEPSAEKSRGDTTAPADSDEGRPSEKRGRNRPKTVRTTLARCTKCDAKREYKYAKRETKLWIQTHERGCGDDGDGGGGKVIEYTKRDDLGAGAPPSVETPLPLIITEFVEWTRSGRASERCLKKRRMR